MIDQFYSNYSFIFFFNDTATTEIYTLSLHDALPISGRCRSPARAIRRRPRPRSARPSKKLATVVAAEAAQHPDTPVEVWATDEHRIGLKPIIRWVWAPKGQRPIALGHHRYKWLYVTAFVQPTSGETFWRDLLARPSGETFWYVSNGVSKPVFAALLALFAREAGAGRERIIALLLDNAGWHTAPNLVVPEGLRLVYLDRKSTRLNSSHANISYAVFCLKKK